MTTAVNTVGEHNLARLAEQSLDPGHLPLDRRRKKDLIIRGGFDVFPRDVEDVSLDHPDVTAAAVVGRPDEESGEEAVAVVAVQPGASVTGEEPVAWCRERLARYKYPREVLVVDNVPLTSVGKTDRKAVRALVDADVVRVKAPA